MSRIKSKKRQKKTENTTCACEITNPEGFLKISHPKREEENLHDKEKHTVSE